MSALGVVEAFDVLRDRALGRRARGELALMHELGLERSEEALHHALSQQFPPQADAAGDPGLFQCPTVVVARVLGSWVRVGSLVSGRLPRAWPSASSALAPDVLAHREAQDAARKQIQNRGQVEPLLFVGQSDEAKSLID